MEKLAALALGFIALLLIVFGPVFVAYWFLLRRKRMARQRRRSPLTADLLRSPGLALREKLDDLRSETSFDVALLLFIPVLPLAYLQALQWVGAPPALAVVVMLGLGSLGVVAWMVRRLLARSATMDQLRLGLDAEQAVGQELDQVMRQGAAVFHDLPADNFNIDHIVIAPQGVFAVETKGFSKPIRAGGSTDATVVFNGKTLAFPEWTSSKPLDQAERQARWLATWLSQSTGEPVVVTPVLALPGWFIERKGRGTVQVLNGKELQRNLLKVLHAAPLDPAQMQRVIHQVEQRCRNAAPLYRPEED